MIQCMKHLSPNSAKQKISIGVSSCLLGNKVRYDGDDKLNSIITEVLADVFELVAVCPETAIGLGIPRPPIQLIEVQGQIRARGVADNKIDVTSALIKFACDFLQEQPDLCGFILTARSPSCGVNSTELFNDQGSCIGKTSGIFAQALQQIKPELPVIGEEALENMETRNVFIEKVNSFHRQR